MKSTNSRIYNVVDLFAGAGGLSYGFLQTGRYKIKAAFENNKSAQNTYRYNHKGTLVFDDVADALTEEMKEKLGQVDVVIGGPPCQGFSNANRQKNHAISQNNSLVKKFVQVVIHLSPNAFVMENVSMLRSSTHKFYVDENDGEIITRFGIETSAAYIPLLDSEFCFDGVEEIVSSPHTVMDRIWNESDYLVLNVVYKNRKNEKKLISSLKKHQKNLLELAYKLSEQTSDDEISRIDKNVAQAIKDFFSGDCSLEKATPFCVSVEQSLMIQRMLSKAREIHNNQIIVESYSLERGLVANVSSMHVLDYVKKILEGSGYSIKDGVLSATTFGAPQKRMRFVVMGVKRELASSISLPVGEFSNDKFRTVKDAIGDIENVEVATEVTDENVGVLLPHSKKGISALGRQLRDNDRLYNHIVTATTPQALERFKAIEQGSNFHSLAPHLKTSYSDPTRTQNTIYLRLKYDEPSGTVVNVRKSMWIHPTVDRAISIREAARLQTFPDSFVFCGKKDEQYQQVGNAVPPILAKEIAEHLSKYLDTM